MTAPDRARFRSLAQLRAAADESGLDIPVDEDLTPLWAPVGIADRTVPNSLAVHPLEGSDASADGAPTQMTERRYCRYARGGAGLLWFEATAVVPDGRSKASQLWLHAGSAGEFARLLENARSVAREAQGSGLRPLSVLQLTHSGRASCLDGRPAPVIAHHHPTLDREFGLTPDYHLISDGELEALQEDYLRAARLAWEAGFDAVDLKACHGNLIAELLTAHTRPGRYGGSFEGRTRFLMEIVDGLRTAVPGLLLASRINGHDGEDHLHGWGMSEGSPGQLDLAEPIRLARALQGTGVRLLSVSLGTGRPRTRLEALADHLATTREIQLSAPELVVIGARYSELGQHFPQVAAAVLRRGWARMVGLGRLAVAYPDFPRDLLSAGHLDPRRVCTACDRCAELLRAGLPVGCVSRDSELYQPICRRLRKTCLARFQLLGGQAEPSGALDRSP